MLARKLWRHGALATALFCSAQGALAAFAIFYQTEDLADTVPGQDLWQYRYFVSGSFERYFEIEIAFETPKVASLAEVPVEPNPDWSVTTVPPLPNVPSDGLYSALALVPSPSLADPFQIRFVWQGPGTPGEQTFNVLNTDPLASDYGLVGSGTTQLAPIPEPYPYTLLAVGLVLVAGWARGARLLS